MYTLVFTEKATKQIEKLESDVQQRILNSLERIKIRPEAFVRKLVGETCFRLRVGHYRVLLDIQHAELVILVIKVGHRSTVYSP